MASSARRLRILLVADWFFHYTAALGAELASSADVMLLTRDHGRELGIDGDASGVKRRILSPEIELVTIGRKQRDVRSIPEVWKARRRIRAFEPDVVHIQPHWDWRLLMATSGCHAPRVMTLHDVTPHPGERVRRNRLQRIVEGRNRRLASAFIVHGQSLARQLEAQPWYGDHQRVEGIPVSTFLQPPVVRPLPELPTVLFFGRMEMYKGLDVFVSAVERAAERMPELRAIIAGRGPALSPSVAMMRRPELFDVRDTFVPDEELPALFSECSVVALPYREASQSGVIPIAYLNGRTVIATRVGALPEAVEDGVDGVLVEAGDPDAFADALISVLANAERPAQMGARGLAAVTTGRLSPARAAGAHLALYQSVVEAHSGGGRMRS